MPVVGTRDALAPSDGARGESIRGDATHARIAGDARPRFALRFEAGHGVLSLARPLALVSERGGAYGEIEELEIDLGRLRGPIDVRGGASRFRSRRGAVTRASVRIDLDALAAEASSEALEARVTHVGAEWVELVLRDSTRSLAIGLVPAWEGEHVVLALRAVRAAIDGPRTPHGDALAMLGALGAALDRERGVLRVDDPIRRALTEALVPHGHRVPSLRGVPRAALQLDGRTLRMRAGTANGATSAGARAALEEARVLAPVLGALADDREDVARGAARELDAGGAAAPALAALLRELDHAAGASVSTDEPGLALRAALAGRDPEGAARWARRLAQAERSDDLAVEALRAASRLTRDSDPATSADLAARALARRPRDAELALEWLDRAAHVLEIEGLVDGVHAIVSTMVGPRRADVLRAAAALLERAGRPDETLRAREEAARLAPDDPSVLEALATSLAAEGRREEALAAWDRVAELHTGDPDGAARARIQAAELAIRAGHVASAAARLEQAAERAESSALRLHALRALSGARRALGAADAAAEVDARVLELAEREGGAVLSSALREVARAAIDAGAEARARAAIDALRRAGEDAGELERELDQQALAALDAQAPEHGAGAPGERALAARAIAERLRASGRLGDAARALARAGVITRDAATLRAALELAEKAEAWDAALEVIERAIEVVGDGPARAQLEARRRAITERR